MDGAPRAHAGIAPSFTVVIVLLLAALAVVDRADADWIADVAGGLVYEDNLSRATRPADRKSGVALTSTVSLGHHFQLGGQTSVVASADFNGSLYPEFDGLNHLASSLTLGVRHKVGLGAFAPWLRVFAAGGLLDYGDNVRDGAVVEMGAQVGKRLTDRIDVEVGYAHESVDAGNLVFNSDAHAFSLKAGVRLMGALQLTLGYTARLGDLVVHRAPSAGAARTSHERVVRTFDTPLVAARISATTHVMSAALGYALTPHAALTLGYEYQISYGPVFNYPNHVARAGIAYSF
jgi:hypothetical protein